MTRAELAAAVAPTLIQLHPKPYGYVATPAEVAKETVRYADAILAELAKAAPKTEPTITGSGHGGGSAHGCDRAADDEAWFWRQRDCGVAKDEDGWVALGCKTCAVGPTIAAAIRALRAKVEGGAR